MTKEELAQIINGTQYPFYPKKGIIKSAKDNNLVIVYGHSDDLIEIDGAICEEIGAYGGVSFRVCKNGLCERPSEDDYGDDDFDDRFKKYLDNKEKSKIIKASGPPWDITTDIPHCKFNILEDDDVQSVGIVFSLNDI